MYVVLQWKQTARVWLTFRLLFPHEFVINDVFLPLYFFIRLGLVKAQNQPLLCNKDTKIELAQFHFIYSYLRGRRDLCCDCSCPCIWLDRLSHYLFVGVAIFSHAYVVNSKMDVLTRAKEDSLTEDLRLKQAEDKLKEVSYTCRYYNKPW